MKKMAINNNPEAIDKKASIIAGIIAGIFTLIVIVIVMISLAHGLEKEERSECIKLREMKKLQGFYVAQLQKEQCEALDITVNAPVR